MLHIFKLVLTKLLIIPFMNRMISDTKFISYHILVKQDRILVNKTQMMLKFTILNDVLLTVGVVVYWNIHLIADFVGVRVVNHGADTDDWSRVRGTHQPGSVDSHGSVHVHNPNTGSVLRYCTKWRGSDRRLYIKSVSLLTMGL